MYIVPTCRYLPTEPGILENSFLIRAGNRQKILRHFYRAHACFVKYFLMTKKWQQIKKLAYVTTCGPSGMIYVHVLYKEATVCMDHLLNELNSIYWIREGPSS